LPIPGFKTAEDTRPMVERRVSPAKDQAACRQLHCIDTNPGIDWGRCGRRSPHLPREGNAAREDEISREAEGVAHFLAPGKRGWPLWPLRCRPSRPRADRAMRWPRLPSRFIDGSARSAMGSAADAEGRIGLVPCAFRYPNEVDATQV